MKEKMNKYFKITLTKYTYDKFDSFVVCAESQEEAVKMIRETIFPDEIDWSGGYTVEQLEGKKEIVLESFKAG